MGCWSFLVPPSPSFCNPFSKHHSQQIDLESSLFVLELGPIKISFSPDPSCYPPTETFMYSSGTVTDSKKKKREGIEKPCCGLVHCFNQKSWTLVDMQGVEVPAKLLNFFLFLLFIFFASGFLYYLAKLLFLFSPCPFSIQSWSLWFERLTVPRLGPLVCMINEPGPARGQSSAAGLQLHPAKCLDGDKFIVVPPAYPR